MGSTWAAAAFQTTKITMCGWEIDCALDER